MKVLLKLILLVILTTVCYSQGKIVSIETITHDFGLVTTEVVMSVAEFTELINQSNKQPIGFESRSMELKESYSTRSTGRTVALKLIGGKLVVGNNKQPKTMNSYSMMSTTTLEDGFKNFNVDMINSLNTMGGEPEIQIQDRSGELVLTNGDYSYNYVENTP